MKTYEALPDDYISRVAEKMVELANLSDDTVTSTFNGIPISAAPGGNAEDIVASYSVTREKEREIEMAQKRVDFIATVESLRSADEKALRDLDMPWPQSDEDLEQVIKALSSRQHDYGTCVYAMSIAAEAAFNLMAHKLGVTGFQASCADMDILRRTRRLKDGFQIIDYNKLLYPQYREQFDECSWGSLLHKNRGSLREKAKALLAESSGAHPDIIAHWNLLAEVKG